MLYFFASIRPFLVRDHSLRHKHMKNRLKQNNPVLWTFAAGAVALSFTFSTQAQKAEDIIFSPEKVKTIPGHGMSKAEYPYDEGGKYRKEWVNTWAKSPVSSSTTLRYPIPKTSKEHSNYAAMARLKDAGNLKRQLAAQKQLASTPRIPNTPTQRVNTPPQTTPVVFNPYKNTAPPPVQQPNVAKARPLSDAELISNGYIGPYTKMVRPRKQIAAPPVVVAQNRPVVAPKPQIKAPTNVAPRTAQPKAATSYHKVKKGDTLFNISQRYGVSVDSLKRSNGLTSDLIRVGQSLRIALAKHALGLPQG